MRYVLSNLGQGLRRNSSMHLAVVLTLFVSLSLVGFGAFEVKPEEKLKGILRINNALAGQVDPARAVRVGAEPFVLGAAGAAMAKDRRGEGGVGRVRDVRKGARHDGKTP